VKINWTQTNHFLQATPVLLPWWEFILVITILGLLMSLSVFLSLILKQNSCSSVYYFSSANSLMNMHWGLVTNASHCVILKHIPMTHVWTMTIYTTLLKRFNPRYIAGFLKCRIHIMCSVNTYVWLSQMLFEYLSTYTTSTGHLSSKHCVE